MKKNDSKLVAKKKKKKKAKRAIKM
jgi:hypothetical protein